MFINYTMYHIYTATVLLKDDEHKINTIYINITDDDLEAMKYISYLIYKGLDITPLKLYKIDTDDLNHLKQFKAEFLDNFKPFLIDELLHGMIYGNDIDEYLTTFINEYPLNINVVA